MFAASVAPIGPMAAVEEPGNAVVVTEVMNPSYAASISPNATKVAALHFLNRSAMAAS